MSRLALATLLLTAAGCVQKDEAPPRHAATSADASLKDLCDEAVGKPRVERVGDRVLVARGYDLANVALVKTSEGSVVIDASMSPTAGRAIRDALLAEAPGPIRALVLTHSHIDHVGGASAFAEPGTEIWATDAFTDHFLKQYGLFQPVEMLRGARQYGHRASREILRDVRTLDPRCGACRLLR